MTNHGYTLKFNDEALSQNLLREKLSFFKSTLLWCQSRTFQQSCVDWMEFGSQRIADLEGALKNKMFSKLPATHPEPRPYTKSQPLIVAAS